MHWLVWWVGLLCPRFPVQGSYDKPIVQQQKPPKVPHHISGCRRRWTEECGVDPVTFESHTGCVNGQFYPSCKPLMNPRRNPGLWCVSTRRDQHKAQKEMWLVSGLQDHRYLSVNKDAKMPVDGPLKKRNAVRTRRYVQYHRHAGPTGSISQPVTEFTYNWKRQRPLPPGPRPQTD